MKKLHPMVLLLSLIALVAYILSFQYPFLISILDIQFPDWLPEFMQRQLYLWIIEKSRISIGPQYLWGMVTSLFRANEIAIGILLTTFSIVLPGAKIIFTLFYASLGHLLRPGAGRTILTILAFISKWSMADVFIVGIFIVYIRAEGFHFKFVAGPGIILFAMAALLSSLSFYLLLWEVGDE